MAAPKVNPNPTVRRNQRNLLLLIALFLLPVIIAWLLINIWRPSGSVHHGELLNPAQQITYWQGEDLTGEQLDKKWLNGRWTLLYLAKNAECGEPCRQGLYNIRQIRLALGKDMDRAQTLLLLPAVPESSIQQWLAQEHAGMRRVVADEQTRALLRDAFTESQQHGIYLIDPLGNLLMRYDLEVAAKSILQDIKRLFKYSKIG